MSVCAIVFFTFIVAMRLMPEPSTNPAALFPAQPAFTLPGGISGPQVPVSMLPADDPAEGPGAIPVKTSLPTTAASRRTRPPAAASTTTPRSITPRTTGSPPTVTGRFQVIDSYGDSFAGEVLLTNTATDARHWRVSLAFPSNVGGLRVSWLEGQPQPTLIVNDVKTGPDARGGIALWIDVSTDAHFRNLTVTPD